MITTQWSTSLIFATLVLACTSSANTCVEVPVPKNPVSHVCGLLKDQAGDPIGHAKVQIWKDHSLFIEAETSHEGNFSFDNLKEGTYGVLFVANGFYQFGFPIVVHKFNQKCQRSLEVVLCINGPCGCSATLKRR